MKHKFLVLAPLFVVLLLLSVSAVAAQDPFAANCWGYAPPFVNEGQTFTIGVKCTLIGPASFYGFQFGTSVTGDASTTATHYTAGNFVAGLAADQFIVGQNSIDSSAANSPGMYAVSRSNGAPEFIGSSGDVVLGTVDYRAATGLDANGLATVNVAPLLVGNKLGGQLQPDEVADTVLPITILDLYTLHLTVVSDGTVEKVRNVTAGVDGVNKPATTPTVAPLNSVTFDFIDDIAMHDIVVSPTGFYTTPSRTPVLTADMRSHLMCSGDLTLTTSPADKTVTLKAGDVNNDNAIGLLDAGAVGWALGRSAATYPDVDVNGDGVIDIFDLIHVGRNYNAVTGPCALS